MSLRKVFFLATIAMQFGGELSQDIIGLFNTDSCFRVTEYIPQTRLIEVFHVIQNLIELYWYPMNLVIFVIGKIDIEHDFISRYTNPIPRGIYYRKRERNAL